MTECDRVIFRDTHYRIEDDVAAMDIALRLGIFSQLGEKVALTFFLYHGHLTHWVLACRFHGFKKPEDNGYTIVVWPKRDYPASVMADYVAKFGRDFQIETLTDAPPLPPPQN